jgi:hypothetical protein
MYLSEEVASLCLQASHETDPHKLIELTRRIESSTILTSYLVELGYFSAPEDWNPDRSCLSDAGKAVLHQKYKFDRILLSHVL